MAAATDNTVPSFPGSGGLNGASFRTPSRTQSLAMWSSREGLSNTTRVGRWAHSLLPDIPPLAAAPDRAHQPQPPDERAGKAEETEGGQAEQGGAALDGHDDGRSEERRVGEEG